MTPFKRVSLIAGWRHGDDTWADTYKSYFESQGLYLTTNPNADRVINFDE
jgi:outer membrane protease